MKATSLQSRSCKVTCLPPCLYLKAESFRTASQGSLPAALISSYQFDRPSHWLVASNPSLTAKAHTRSIQKHKLALAFAGPKASQTTHRELPDDSSPGDSPWKGVLPKEKVALIQSSYKEVDKKVTAVGFGKLFYQTLFEMAPGAKDLFKMAPEIQEKMFADTLTLLVTDIDDAEKVVPVLLALATRHNQYGVQEAHFSVVGAGLLGTLRLALGPAFTPPVEGAWTDLWKITTEVMWKQIEAVRSGEANS